MILLVMGYFEIQGLVGSLGRGVTEGLRTACIDGINTGVSLSVDKRRFSVGAYHE